MNTNINGKRKMKGKNLKARRGRSTIMKWQGSYQVGRKVLNLPQCARYSCADSQLKDPKNVFFSNIYLNITKFELTEFIFLTVLLWFRTVCLKMATLKETQNCERLGDVPNKASNFPHALKTYLYLLINANLSVKFFKVC